MQTIQERTRAFALQVVKVYSLLPKTTEAQVLGKQLLRSGTSVGAHYREGIRARSDQEFISKLQVGLQELEEAVYWLELIILSGIFEDNSAKEVMNEAKELIAILVTVTNKVKKRILN